MQLNVTCITNQLLFKNIYISLFNSLFILNGKVSVQLYHGPAKERMSLLKQIRKPQGPHNMCPVVVTSFEIAMIDRKFLQVGPTPLLIM